MEAGERDRAGGGAVLEEQISYFDWAAVAVDDVGLDLRSRAGTSLDNEVGPDICR